jgi:hypothetical protein
MVDFHFHDANVGHVDYDEDTIEDDVPETVHLIVKGPIGDNHEALSRILGKRSKTFQTMSVEDFGEASPEYLTLLVSLFNKTQWVHLSDCLVGDI